MINAQAQATAIHILEDRKGADYYRDPSVLADYLKSSLGSSDEIATRLAEDINSDRFGANFYADEKILGALVESRMGVVERTA